MARPALPAWPAIPPSATLPLRLRVTPLRFALGLGPGMPSTRVLSPLKPNLVSLMMVGVRIWVRLATAFCGTMLVRYWLSVEFWVCADSPWSRKYRAKKRSLELML